jgi:hypothetical protein
LRFFLSSCCSTLQNRIDRISMALIPNQHSCLIPASVVHIAISR